MDRNELKKLTQNLKDLGAEHTPALKDLVAQYPYFQLGQMLYLKALHNQESYHFNTQLKIAASHTLDRTRVYELIKGNVNIEVRKLNEAPVYKQDTSKRVADEILPPTQAIVQEPSTPAPNDLSETVEVQPEVFKMELPVNETQRTVAAQEDDRKDLPRPQSRNKVEEQSGDLSKLSIEDIKERVKRILAEREQMGGKSLHTTLDTNELPKEEEQTSETFNTNIESQEAEEVVAQKNELISTHKEEEKTTEAAIEQALPEEQPTAETTPLVQEQPIIPSLPAQEKEPKATEEATIQNPAAPIVEDTEGLSQAEIYRRKAQAIIEKSRQLKQKLESEHILPNAADQVNEAEHQEEKAEPTPQTATQEPLVRDEKETVITEEQLVKQEPTEVEATTTTLETTQTQESQEVIPEKPRIHFEIETEQIQDQEAEEVVAEQIPAQEPEEKPETTPIRSEKPLQQEVATHPKVEEDLTPPAPDDMQGFLHWLKAVNQKKKEENSKAKAPQPTQKAPQPNQLKSEKKELIDSFINSNMQFKPEKKKMESAPIVDLSERYTDASSDLMTETLAQVYAEQGHKTKAIQAYEILKLKYPEKSSYFAAQINKLKKDK